MNWEKLRYQVLQRDEYTCQICLKKLTKLDVHHIIPRRKDGLNSPNNLIAVCEKCHETIELNPTSKNDNLKKVVFRLDAGDIEKVKIVAAKKRTTQNDCFNEAMQDFLKKNEKLWK